MFSHSFEQSGYLMSILACHYPAEIAVAKSADAEFSANYGTEQIKVITVKEIESAVTAVIVLNGFGYPVEVFDSAAGIIDTSGKLKIPAIGRLHQFGQHSKAVNGFSQRRIFHFRCSVPMFHPSAVLKKRDIISHCFNSKDDTELVIHLYGNLAHPMFDAGSFYPRVKVIAHFVLICCMEFAAKERGYIFGFDRENCSSYDFFVNRLKVIFVLKDNICCIFNLHNAPMIITGKMSDYRTILSGDFIKLAVNFLYIDAICQHLGLAKIVNLGKDIIEHLKRNVFLFKYPRQQVVSVKVKLKPERCPCRNSQIAQPQFGRDEIEVIVQAFTGNCFEICSLSLFVMPWFIGGAGFHSRINMYQAGMGSALLDDIVNPAFATNVGLIVYGSKLGVRQKEGLGAKFKISSMGFFGKIVDSVRNLLP